MPDHRWKCASYRILSEFGVPLSSITFHCKATHCGLMHQVMDPKAAAVLHKHEGLTLLNECKNARNVLIVTGKLKVGDHHVHEISETSWFCYCQPISSETVLIVTRNGNTS